MNNAAPFGVWGIEHPVHKMQKNALIRVGQRPKKKRSPEEKAESDGMKHYQYCLMWLMKHCDIVELYEEEVKRRI